MLDWQTKHNPATAATTTTTLIRVTTRLESNVEVH